MACETVKLDDQVVVTMCIRGRRRRGRCYLCPATHEYLCDGPGQRPGRTCDRKLCADHRVNIGPDRDLCPECAIRAGVPICGVKPSGSN